MQQKYIISKQKNPEKNRYPLRLGSISKDFTTNSMKKKKQKNKTKQNKNRIKCTLVQFFC